MKRPLALLLFLMPVISMAQTSIRGNITDITTKEPLQGATILLDGKTDGSGVLSDAQGRFEIANVPAGRHFIRVTFLGYEPTETETFLHQSSKESYFEIKLSEGSIQGNEVIVTANKNAFEPLNELSVVSTRSFTSEETERIPAGINDPGRVVLSYPGVTIGADDNENQIIVRGNSPVGILWRLEGIDIPNPNHFAVIGSSGGGITVFSAQLLAKSDFNTGGFAAEYGNALSGAFDIHFRPGNFYKREHRVKIGLLGLDFATEGPLKNERSSYLINYRYSTLGLLSAIGFNFVGERVTNEFQDLSFNLTFKSKNQKSVTTVFGMGGLSEENYQPVDIPEERDLTISNHSEDRVRPANMTAMGVTNTFRINSKGYLKTVVALMASDIKVMNDTLSLTNERFRYETQNFTDKRIASSITLNQKFSSNFLFKSGIIANFINFDFLKEKTPRTNVSDINELQTEVSVAGSGRTSTIQHYSQFSYLKNKWRLNAGYHFLRLNLNNKFSIEPRASLQFTPTASQKISFSYGLHSQIPPMMNYFYQNSEGELVNNDLELMKTRHLVLAYHLYTKNRMRLSLEAYHQKLFNIPASPLPESIYWMLNAGGNFPEFSVVSEGGGMNKGVDLALEKTFSQGYYFLLNGSVFDAKYSMPDGRTFNSRFNSRYSSALTLGKEFYFKKGRILQIGGRYLFKGGFRYTPPDLTETRERGYYFNDISRAYEGQVGPYKRLDGRMSYTYNGNKVAGKINLDIQNVLNTRNPSSLGYNFNTNETYLIYRGAGFTPVLSFQWDF
ncbi:carboxypeptidase-like regulatory domain-containing protein [Jiulongibacter sp. NS-SX5]|uniref:carboxypeptidase-like regulatory domain-containing protein n=1 Tax=Jiulongibacter sp. NS-SX5 TaxID=3463854 RepID=UPI0040593782